MHAHKVFPAMLDWFTNWDESNVIILSTCYAFETYCCMSKSSYYVDVLSYMYISFIDAFDFWLVGDA